MAQTAAGGKPAQAPFCPRHRLRGVARCRHETPHLPRPRRAAAPAFCRARPSPRCGPPVPRCRPRLCRASPHRAAGSRLCRARHSRCTERLAPPAAPERRPGYPDRHQGSIPRRSRLAAGYSGDVPSSGHSTWKNPDRTPRAARDRPGIAARPRLYRPRRPQKDPLGEHRRDAAGRCAQVPPEHSRIENTPPASRSRSAPPEDTPLSAPAVLLSGAAGAWGPLRSPRSATSAAPLAKPGADDQRRRDEKPQPSRQQRPIETSAVR